MPSKKVPVLSFLLGFCAITAQALIMRAFQTVFYGNEISYAVVLASWLLWVGMGSLLTSAVRLQAHFTQKFLFASFCALALSIPGMIFGIRYIKPILGVGAGQMIGIVPMIVSGLILTAPIGFFIGAVFVLLCGLTSSSGSSSTGVYFFESFGSAIGGALFSFVLLHFLSATMIAWFIAAMIFSGMLWAHGKERTLRWITVGLLAFVLIFIGLDSVYQLDRLSQEKQYPFGNLVAVEDSPYANIAVVEREGDYSVYQNGLLSFTTDDRLSAEENVHFALLAHPNPKNVLLIGNGLGGEISEILKYPDIHVDFVEIDSQLIDMARHHLPADVIQVLEDPRVAFYAMDARRFVRITENHYDVIIVNVGDPYTAGLNRYYTLEFFAELDRILNLGGIASWRVSSSENFLSEENWKFLRSIHRTLSYVFPEVRSIPGDTHTFLASNSVDRISVDAPWLVGRLLGSGIHNKFLNEYTLPFRLTRQRIDRIEQDLTREKGMLNRDLFPRTYLFQIVLWSTHFDAGTKALMEMIALPFQCVLILCVIAICLIMYWKTRRDKFGAVDVAVSTTGFSEIIFEVVVILAFQSLYGIAYDKIGFILASFMFGLVVGARWAMTLARRKMSERIRMFQRVQCGVTIYPLFLPLVFIVFRDSGIARQWNLLFALLFAFLPFIAGFMGGLQYPLAVAIRRESRLEKEAHSAGALYSLDIFGAAIGALMTGALLIPLYGIVAVCVLCAAVNGVVLIFLGNEKR